jgi:hypothetical protein
MDLRRLRFGDWVMGIGGLAVLLVMFLEWYEPVAREGNLILIARGDPTVNAWEAFAVTDVILALAALMGVAAFVLAVTQPTAAVPLAIASLTALFSILTLLLVILRVIWPPDLDVAVPAFGTDLETGRATGAWLGLVATTILAGGALASIRDERVPRPQRPVEPRLVSR